MPEGLQPQSGSRMLPTTAGYCRKRNKEGHVKKFPIEAGHILLFARAVGDDNKIYADADYAKTTEPGSNIAPATSAISSANCDPHDPLPPRLWQPSSSYGDEHN